VGTPLTRVKRFCVGGQKVDAQAATQPVAPLPEFRIRESPPFSAVGIDHAGPLYCSDFNGKKFYVLLFTCAVVRAVHLELVNSLNVEDCVLAIRRFIARRSLPSLICSDNAKTFVAAKDQLLRLYGPSCPEWRFIAPRAPWWGGWWERLVRSVKSGLRKSVGQKCLSKSELETILHEVEACINCRPLTFVGDSEEDKTPLTPACFLVGKTCIYDKGVAVSKGADKLILQGTQLVRNILMDQFWATWLKEYVQNLPTCGKKRESNLKLG
jgi:hypothetical protein